MTMFSQKYTNNIRTVSGTVDVYPDDVILNCTTSTAAVTVNLQEIPADHWSVQWRLYIIDKSNNSATNNITINAPLGYTINGAASIVINSNSGSVIIKVVNNTSYLAVYSYGTSAATTNGHIIQDEGVSLTQRAKLNFIGSSVTATDNSSTNATDVTIHAPYLYAVKLLQTAGAYYGIDAAGTRSVVNGQATSRYDSKVESGITGFDITTGQWTVATTGYYSVGAKLTTRINAGSVDTPTDSLGAAWITLAPIDGGIGFVGIGIVISRTTGGLTKKYVVCSNKQTVNNNISDINIECTAVEFPFQANDIVSVFIINKTNHSIDGIATSDTLPDCYTDFSVKQ